MSAYVVIKRLKSLTVSVDIYITKLRRPIELMMRMMLSIVLAGQCSIYIKEYNSIRFM